MKNRILAMILACLCAVTLFAGCGEKEPQVQQEPGLMPEESALPTTEPGLMPEETPMASAPADAPTQVPTKAPTKAPTQAPTEKPEVSLSHLMNQMIGALPKDSYTLTQIPDEFIGNGYQIDASQYESVLVYGSMMGVHANEIILLKAKNQAGVSLAKQTLENRKNQLIEQWKSYLPEQYELVKQSKIVTNGLYAAFVCANSQNSAVNAFHAALK